MNPRCPFFLLIAASDIINVAGTLVAAFAGAWFAFLYQNRQKQSEERKQNISAGNRALVTLLQQANTLKLYQKDIIDPIRKDPVRYISMQPTLQYREDGLTYDLAALDFLLVKYTQVAFDLLLEEERYRETLKAINARSRFHLDVVQPSLALRGIVEGDAYREQDFRDALGEPAYPLIVRLTDAVVLHVDRTIDSLMAAKEGLRKALLELYPGETFINFDLLENPPESIFK